MGPTDQTTLNERYLKKNIWSQPQTIHLRYPSEFVAEVESELREILSTPLQQYSLVPQVGKFESSLMVSNVHYRQIFELIARLLTVRDLLWELYRGSAGGYSELKSGLQKIPWEAILPAGTKIALRVRSIQSRLFHENALKDVLSGFLVSRGYVVSEPQEASVHLELLLQRNILRVLLSTFGRPGGERGFKTSLKALAPLKGEIGACLHRRVQRTMLEEKGRSWPEVQEVIIPFAGSGTLAAETLLGILKSSPLILGREYFFEKLICRTEKSNDFIREKLFERASGSNLELFFSLIENDPVQFLGLEENLASLTKLLARNVSLKFRPVIVQGDFQDYHLKGNTSCYLPLNPPYGERLEAGEREYSSLISSWLASNPFRGFGYLLRKNETGNRKKSGERGQRGGRSQIAENKGRADAQNSLRIHASFCDEHSLDPLVEVNEIPFATSRKPFRISQLGAEGGGVTMEQSHSFRLGGLSVSADFFQGKWLPGQDSNLRHGG